MSGKYFLRASVKAIVFSSFFISVSAVSLTLSTCLILVNDFSISPALLSVVFFSTLLIYNLNVLQFGKSDFNRSVRELWKVENKQVLQIVCVLCLVGLAWSCFFFSFKQILFLLHLGMLSVGYVLPLRVNGKLVSLRSFPFLKIVVLSYVWTSVTVLLPAMNLNIEDSFRVFLLFLERFLFIFAICIPFDVRDYYTDRHAGIITLPNSLGINQSLWIAKILLVFYVSLSFLFHGFSYILYTRLICAAIAFIFVDRTKMKQSDFFYMVGIDGLMIMYFVILSLMKLLIPF
jgi:4-hydroxybenzoate polyprenyltransferase